MIDRIIVDLSKLYLSHENGYNIMSKYCTVTHDARAFSWIDSKFGQFCIRRCSSDVNPEKEPDPTIVKCGMQQRLNSFNLIIFGNEWPLSII